MDDTLKNNKGIIYSVFFIFCLIYCIAFYPMDGLPYTKKLCYNIIYDTCIWWQQQSLITCILQLFKNMKGTCDANITLMLLSIYKCIKIKFSKIKIILSLKPMIYFASILFNFICFNKEPRYKRWCCTCVNVRIFILAHISIFSSFYSRNVCRCILHTLKCRFFLCHSISINHI